MTGRPRTKLEQAFPRCAATIWDVHRAMFCSACSCSPSARCRVVYASEAGQPAVYDRRAEGEAPIETTASYRALVEARLEAARPKPVVPQFDSRRYRRA